MDPVYPDHRGENTYSHAHRSRTDSGVSTTEGLFHTLRLVDSPVDTFDTSSYTSSRPQSSRGPASPTHITAAPAPSAAFFPPPSSQSPFPLISDSVLDTDWFDTHQASNQVGPLLRVEPPLNYSELTPSSSPSPAAAQSASMSTVALQYDPTFNLAGRSFPGWPISLESGGLLGHDLSSYASDVSLTPPTASRSITASPPRGTLTAEQRELKRQRDQLRRDSKMSRRQRRADSGSSYVSSPPMSLADLTTASSSMPIYTTAPSQISVLAEPVTTTIAPQQYMSSYSPPLESQSNMFSGQYSPQPYIGMGAYSSYPATTAPNLASHYGRPSIGDPNMMYAPVPSVMGSGGSSGQEGTHVRVVQSRPKPQCWEHGCNGRQFSTFSNLLRHQREKSGQAAKATCPNCGAEFTRTTARNGHLLHDKCKQKRNSTSSQ